MTDLKQLQDRIARLERIMQMQTEMLRTLKTVANGHHELIEGIAEHQERKLVKSSPAATVVH
jgi:hypothetical protein